MGERYDVLDASLYKFLSQTLDGLGYVVDTADGRDDPDFIADAYFAVSPAVAVKETLFGRSDSSFLSVIGIGQQVAKTGF